MISQRMRPIWVTAALALVTVLAWLVASLPAWVWHPLVGKGYQLWSGIASDVGEITLPVTLIAGALTLRSWLHQHFECHKDTCHKLGFHHVEGTPYRTCWSHHPVLSKHEKHGVPLSHIHRAHQEATSGPISIT
jgi:hypothetical protein